MSRRYKLSGLIYALVFLMVEVGCLPSTPSGDGLIIDKIYPVVVRANEDVYVWVRNLPADMRPNVYFAGNQIEVMDMLPLLSGTTLIVVRVPGIFVNAPIKIAKAGSSEFAAVSSSQTLTVIYSDTLKYPADTTYKLGYPSGLSQITPFGQQHVLVVVGYPTDVIPTFTLVDFDADMQNRFATVNSYYGVVSQNHVSLSATIFPWFLPLSKTYGEYIYESRFPFARGVPVHYPIDLTSYAATDPNMSITIQKPDGSVHTITLAYPLSIYSASTLRNFSWTKAHMFFASSSSFRMYFVDHGSEGISLDIFPWTESGSGSGYKITSLSGSAWAAFGLSPSQVQLFDGSGIPSSGLVGLDKSDWTSELLNDLLATTVDLSNYSSINYMLVGEPGINNTCSFSTLCSYGYLESHYLYARAMVASGWMRLNHNEDWTTWAHETGHNLGLTDEYPNSFSQPLQFMGGWTLMGYNGFGSHITAWEKGPRIGQYSTSGSWIPPSSILQAALPGPSGEIVSTTVNLAPMYGPLPTFPGDPDPVAYAAEIRLSPLHSIFLEGRQGQPQVAPRVFDEKLDFIDTAAGHKGVLIYDIRNEADLPDWPNVRRQEMMLLSPYSDALDMNNRIYLDPATGVTVTVLGELGSAPDLSFKVKIDVGRANPPQGVKFDAYITPWDSAYQSPDIWVDSPLNGYDIYEATSFTADGDPNGSGDSVGVGAQNRLYARIRNLGPEQIPSAAVTFWVADPGIGDRADWQRLDTVTVGPIPAGGSIKTYTVWIPRGDVHSCAMVEVAPIEGEITFTNNMAQENFSNFETVTGSPYQPVNFSFDLFNSSESPRQFALRVRSKIPLLDFDLDHAFPVVPAGGHITVHGTFTIDKEVAPGSKSDAPLVITAFTPWIDSEIEIGGISLNIMPRKESTIRINVEKTADGWTISGDVTGGNFPRPVTLSLNLIAPTQAISYIQGRTDSGGHFEFNIPSFKEKGSVADVYVFAPATYVYGSARSETVRLP